MDKYKKSCSWGTIFGLNSLDLTDAQLKKIESNKLSEFAISDPRVEKIISERLLKGDFETFKNVTVFDEKEFIVCKTLFSAYNDGLRIFEQKLQKDKGYYWRSDFCKWELLDEINKYIEIDRYLNKDKSVLNINNLKISNLYDKYYRINDLIHNIIITENNSYSQRKIDEELFSTLSKEKIEQYITVILTKKSSRVCFLLKNSNLSEEHTILTLRKIAGKDLPPCKPIMAKITKAMLKKIPSVTRLRVMETLYIDICDVKAVVDINAPEDFNDILFGVSLKYNERAKRVVVYFNKLLENNRRK
jgi:hypothetical protein